MLREVMLIYSWTLSGPVFSKLLCSLRAVSVFFNMIDCQSVQVFEWFLLLQWRSYPLDLVDKSRGDTLLEGGKM